MKWSGFSNFFRRPREEKGGKRKEDDSKHKDLMYYLKEEKKKGEPPRNTYYINEGRINERFPQYFFSHGSKLTITTQSFGEAGMDVNWLIARFGGKLGGMRGETVEIDNERIPPVSKALVIESYAKDKGLLLHPVNDNVREKEVLYKYVGECYFVAKFRDGTAVSRFAREDGQAIEIPELNSVLSKKAMELIESRRSQQEKESIELEYPGRKIVWLVPTANRTVVSILSTSWLKASIFVRDRGPRGDRGFIGSFEDSIQKDGHNILFLTPWWIWR